MRVAFNNEYCSGKSVRVSQHVTVKAKVANLIQVKKDNSRRFNIVQVELGDPSRSIKRILWESSVNSVQLVALFLDTFCKTVISYLKTALTS